MATLNDLARQYYDAQVRRAGMDSRYKATTDEAGIYKNLNNAASTFQNLFKNLVGRDPNEGEFEQFYGVLSQPENLEIGAHESRTPMEMRDITTQFINDNFQRQAEEQAKNELMGQQQEANRLADLYRTQGNQAINDTQSALMDYQNRLFEKLRPQLITSLQTQGLLNTGGLNEAFAGAAGDLAAAGQEELRQQRLGVEQGANEIAFGGASAPYQFAQQQSMNRLGNLAQAGQTAQQNAYNTAMQQMAFNNQLKLEQFRMQNQPKTSLLKQMGGQILGNIASTFVPGVGGVVGNNMWRQSGVPMPGPGGVPTAGINGVVKR